MKKYRYLVLILLFLTATYIWSSLFASSANDVLEVHFFDVGQGDSIFIETAQGQQVLIDGGPNAVVLEKLGQQMDFWDRYLDLVVLTHPDADHLTGLLEVVKNFEIGLVLVSGVAKDNQLFNNWQVLLEEKEITVKTALAGQKIELGQGIYLEVLWPNKANLGVLEEVNNYSVVLKLDYQEAEFLLTGDIEKSTELALVNEDIQADVLKVAHHGSRGSTNPLFLDKVNPQVAVICVGENSYGHPHPDVLERLVGLKVLRTDLDDDISILADGFKLWIK